MNVAYGRSSRPQSVENVGLPVCRNQQETVEAALDGVWKMTNAEKNSHEELARKENVGM